MYFRCSECRSKTSSTLHARAAAKVCVKCRPDLDAAPAKAKTKPARAVAPLARGKTKAVTPTPAIERVPAPAPLPTSKIETPVPVVKPEATTPAASACIKAPTTASGSRKKLSGLDAAAMVLRDSAVPMTPQEIFTVCVERDLWASPKGKTPCATLAAAIGREIAAGGPDCRFVKPERGKFAANPATA
jgi:hypothetical protein